MAARRPTPEQVIGKLGEAEVAKGGSAAAAFACEGIDATEQGSCRLAPRGRRPEGGPGQAPRGVGGRERPPRAAPGRGRSGQSDPEGGRLGEMPSPAKRREAVEHVCRALGPGRASRRRACEVSGRCRSTRWRVPAVPGDAPRPVARRVGLAIGYGRYGYRRVAAVLRAEGSAVSHERVGRLRSGGGLKGPRRQPGRGRPWLNDGSCMRPRPGRQDHAWSCDFVRARTRDGRASRMLDVIDECTRDCLAIDVARKLQSDDVLGRLSGPFVLRPVARAHPPGQRAGVRGQGRAGGRSGSGSRRS